MALYYTRGFTAQYVDDFDDLPFDIDTLSRTVERLVMASAPWQAYYMNMRQLYRWENPRRTGFWFVIWLILWKIQHIGTFLVSCGSGLHAGTLLTCIVWLRNFHVAQRAVLSIVS